MHPEETHVESHSMYEDMVLIKLLLCDLFPQGDSKDPRPLLHYYQNDGRQDISESSAFTILSDHVIAYCWEWAHNRTDDPAHRTSILDQEKPCVEGDIGVSHFALLSVAVGCSLRETNMLTHSKHVAHLFCGAKSDVAVDDSRVVSFFEQCVRILPTTTRSDAESMANGGKL